MLKGYKTIKQLLILILIFCTSLGAKSEYNSFIAQQISYVYEMNENNITKEQIDFILDAQEQGYSVALDRIMSNKQKYINNINIYDSDIFALEKIIRINKRAGNSYAVIRDEVQIKSFQLISNQRKMIQNILISLNDASSKEYNDDLNRYVVENQNENQKLFKVDYRSILEIKSESKTLKLAQENIREFYALMEINEDIVSHLYLYEKKMFRLNKYSKYHLIAPVMYIDNIGFVKTINSILEIYGLNVVKILFIIFLIFLIYFIRKILFISLDRYIVEIDSLKKYSKDILEILRKPINILIVIININIIVYVYNDFISIDEVARFFNILYGIFFTLIIYRVSNTVANIKIHEIDTTNNKVKNEIVNVGIKIANFIIIMIGLLIILYFAGVNLTAVLSGLGIGGFAVALAAKDSLANFFGTLSILFSDVFSQGDWIEVNGQEGTVVEIGLRVTTLRTFDNAIIAIPNSILANKDVKNWNKRSLGRRIKMSLGIKYNSKQSDIQKAVKEIREMLDKHPQIATENTKYTHSKSKIARLVSKDDMQGIKKTLLVYLDEFSDSSINILIYCFSKSVVWDEWLEVKQDVMYKIMQIMEDNSLEFAFPSMSIYREKE